MDFGLNWWQSHCFQVSSKSPKSCKSNCDSLTYLLRLNNYQTDDTGPVYGLSQDVSQVAHDENDQGLDDSRISGVLQKKGR